MGRHKDTETLVTEAQRGVRQSFDELLSIHRPWLEKQIRSLMADNLQVKVGVEDVAQETSLRAFQALPKLRYNNERSFLAWLRTIAEHVIWNLSQKKAWSQIRLVRDVPRSGTAPSQRLRRDERFDRLQEAIAALPADYRQVLTLSRIEGLQVKEIAQRIDRSPNAVRKLLARAMIELRRSFGDTESFHLPDRSLGTEEGGHEA